MPWLEETKLMNTKTQDVPRMNPHHPHPQLEPFAKIDPKVHTAAEVKETERWKQLVLLSQAAPQIENTTWI